jgi:lipoate-protein ligase A
LTGLKVIRDGAQTGVLNMQRDAELLAGHQPGDDPILRLYRWNPPAISIGYNQQFSAFDSEVAIADGVDLVRRPTGGRAILHAEELTYSVVGTSPGPLFGDSLHSSYQLINQALLLFLQSLDIQADVSQGESRAEARGVTCFKSAGRHEISVGGCKLVGSAQRRTGGVFLQHGSILTGPAHQNLPRYLSEGAPGAGVGVDDLRAVTTDLGKLLGGPLTEEDLDSAADKLAAAFAQVLDLEMIPD